MLRGNIQPLRVKFRILEVMRANCAHILSAGQLKENPLLLPYRVMRRTETRPYLTYALIAVNMVVFFWELTIPDAQLFATFRDIAITSCQVTTQFFSPKTWVDMLRSMFLHGSFTHLFGNMLYLVLFGPSVEEYFGRRNFLLFYFVAGFAAHFTHVGVQAATTNLGCALPPPAMPILGMPAGYIPLIGASGAIAGLMGGFMLLHPGTKVRSIVPLFRGFGPSFDVPSLFVIGLWFGLQIISGFLSIGPTGTGTGVAFWAHIGGFITGGVMVFIATMWKPAPPQNLID